MLMQMHVLGVLEICVVGNVPGQRRCQCYAGEVAASSRPALGTHVVGAGDATTVATTVLGAPHPCTSPEKATWQS